MLLILLLGVLPILHVCSEEVTVDTDACLRGAKARHGDNPNDELDSFLACVLARLDAVSFPQLTEIMPNQNSNIQTCKRKEKNTQSSFLPHCHPLIYFFV